MFTKKEVLSIPNILCYLRILLVPVFVYIYFKTEIDDAHFLSAFIVIISSITDFLDGYIARKYDMVTDLGKLIDPIADKLTQFVIACTLVHTYPAYIWMVIIIVLKDGMLLFVGYYILRKTGKHLDQAQLPGKVATAVFFVISIILIAFSVPYVFANIMIYVTVFLMVLAMIHYGRGLYQLSQE